MKNYNYIAIVLFTCCFAALGYGQQKTTYAFYNQNMALINPAYAGADGQTSFTGIVRSQWQGVKNAPESQAFTFGSAVGKRVGLGLSIENEKTFVETQQTVNVDFSYMLPMDEELTLYLGLKAGGNFYDVNTSGLQTWNYDLDPSLVGFSRFNPNVGVGAYLKHENYFLSLSAPRIFETKRAREEEGRITTAADRVHLYFSGGYDFSLSEELVLKPYVMMRYVNAAPLSVDFTALMSIHDKFEVGASYRTDEVLSGLAIIQVFDWLGFGYAYENSFRSELRNVSNGTHELLLNFQL
ncbi:PorP/SprF family type IX secretion system membrane protein [Salinimicrobium sp. CAU 1759]